MPNNANATLVNRVQRTLKRVEFDDCILRDILDGQITLFCPSADRNDRSMMQVAIRLLPGISVVLIDFIHLAQAEGHELRESIIRSVAVRTRPILLITATTLLANWVITLDPVFSGLAWAIIFGIVTSTFFTLIVIPVAYWILYRNENSLVGV